jgi:hypothetical protein
MKIETNIDQETLSKLKEELAEKQLNFIMEKVDSKDFENSLNEQLTRFVNFAMDKPIKYYIQNTDEIKKELKLTIATENIQKLAYKYGRVFFDFIKQYVKNYEVKIEDLLTDEIIKKVENAIDKPLDLDKETVKTFIDQKAVKELFVTIIYTALEKFVKNIPFTGGLFGKTGVFEREIKKFISGGMNFTIDIATNFITDKKNEELIQSSLKKLFRNLIEINLNTIMSRVDLNQFDSGEGETFHNLLTHLTDMKMIKDTIDYTIEQIYHGEGEKSIREILNDEEAQAGLVKIISENMSILILEYFKSDRFKSFLKRNIDDFYHSLEV